MPLNIDIKEDVLYKEGKIEGKIEGKLEGLEEGKEKVITIAKLFKKGLPIEKIAIQTNSTNKKVKEIIKDLFE